MNIVQRNDNTFTLIPSKSSFINRRYMKKAIIAIRIELVRKTYTISENAQGPYSGILNLKLMAVSNGVIGPEMMIEIKIKEP